MKQYLALVKTVIKKGKLKTNRTGTDTISYFGLQTRYDLAKGFPLLTTKKVYFKGILHELLWFLKGDTNIEYLVKNNVKIWNEWAFENYKKHQDYHGETMEEFINLIKTNHSFAVKFGDLGPIYGKQWRNFNGIDQLRDLVTQLQKNPDSRRLIVSAWNPQEISKMALPPCHTMFQLYAVDNKLSLHLYQRSADIFLGVPFNIASYALLLQMLCHSYNFEVGEFIHSIGDGHIYVNHLPQLKTQLKRRPKKLPKLVIKEKYEDLESYKFEDFKLMNYKSYPAIKGEVAV